VVPRSDTEETLDLVDEIFCRVPERGAGVEKVCNFRDDTRLLSPMIFRDTEPSHLFIDALHRFLSDLDATVVGINCSGFPSQKVGDRSRERSR
jgi:hypothetical protein